MKNQWNIELKTFEPIKVVSIRTKDSLYAMGKYFGQLYGKARNGGLRPSGPLFCVYYEKPDDPQAVDYELFLPVSGNAEGVRDFGGERCAWLRLHGSYSQFGAAYQAMGDWVAERKLEMIAPPREVYVRGPLFGFLTFIPVMVTDIHFPVKA